MASHSSQNRSNVGKSVTEILGKVLEPVLARKTGMRLDLVKAWPELVGEAFAKTTRPEKIQWPRRSNEDDPFKPATLIIACEPSVALFFQHDQAAIIERVNVFFGFQAIDRFKVLQKPVLSVTASSKTQEKALSALEVKKLSELLKTIEDPQLRETLSKLGKGIISNRD